MRKKGLLRRIIWPYAFGWMLLSFGVVVGVFLLNHLHINAVVVGAVISTAVAILVMLWAGTGYSKVEMHQ